MKNQDFILIIPPPTPSGPKVIFLGSLFLADSLINSGFSVKIIDDTVENISDIVSNSVGPQTIAFGISTLSGFQLYNAIKIAKFLKAAYPNIPIIFGGAHATALPLQTLEAEFIDYIVYGEGEISLPLLLKAIVQKKDYSKIKGIGFKDAGVCFITEKPAYTDLNKVFKIPYALLNMQKYARELIIGPKRSYYIMTSRGCPFRCRFCSNSSSTWPNVGMRYHTVEHILSDILTLVNDYEADGINFGDENFFIKEKRVEEICHSLIKSGLSQRVKFRAAGRADTLSKLSESTWRLLKKAGFIAISVGIESGSERILRFIGKGITLMQICRTDELLNTYDFYKGYNFMVCLPGETIDDIKETLKLIVHLAKTSLKSPYPFGAFNKYIPLPGTEMYDLAIKDYGLKPPDQIEDWKYFDNVWDSCQMTRPWLTSELANYICNVDLLVQELGNLYRGEHSDFDSIERQIKKIEAVIYGEDL